MRRLHGMSATRSCVLSWFACHARIDSIAGMVNETIMNEVLVRKLADDAVLPEREHPDDAGADIASHEDMVLAPGERGVVGTGLSIAFPAGWLCYVVPRSGLALKDGITIVNAPGLVDAGYRGELKVILLNTGSKPFHVCKGQRIAQLVFQRCELAGFREVEGLPDSVRGEGGFGSTGVN